MKKVSSSRRSKSPRMRRSNSLGSNDSIISLNEGILPFLSDSEDSIGSTGSLHKKKTFSKKLKPKTESKPKFRGEDVINRLTHHTLQKHRSQKKRMEDIDNLFLTKEQMREKKELEHIAEANRKYFIEEKDERTKEAKERQERHKKKFKSKNYDSSFYGLGDFFFKRSDKDNKGGKRKTRRKR
jgi:hypothetical protein